MVAPALQAVSYKTLARYTVRDGAGAVLGYNTLNHSFVAPNDFTADGAAWETVGLARLEGDTLVDT